MSNWTIPFVVRLDQGAPFIQQTAQGLMLPGDHEAHTIKTTVLDHEEPAALSGTPMGYFRRKDGVTVKCAGTLDGNVLSVTMDDACYLPGPLRCVIRLLTDVENDLGMSLVEAQFFVREGTGDAIIDPDDVIPSVRVQAEQIAALQQTTGALDARVDDLENAPALVQELELNSTYWAKHPDLSDVNPRVVRKGGVVFLEGVLTNVQALTFGASTVYSVATLPSWAYPANSVVFVEQAANTAIFNLAAYANNSAYELQISHHMVGGSNTDASANSVWRLNCCWLAADVSGETVDDLEALIAQMEAINNNAVRYDAAQVLTDAQKTQARTNIAAAGAAEVDELESALDCLADLTTVTDETTTTIDIYGTLSWTGGYMGVNGTTGEANNMHYSNKIAVAKGDILTAVALYTTTAFRYVTAFNGDSVVSASGDQNVLAYTVPDGVDGIIVTTYVASSQYAPSAINYTHTTYSTKNIYVDDIDDLHTIESVVQTENFIEYEESDVTPTFTSGGINIDGSSLAYTDYEYTQKIPVVSGDVIEAMSDDQYKAMRWVCAYSGTSAISSKGSNSDERRYTVPDGIDGIVITVRKADDVDAIHITTHTTDSSAYIKPIPMGYMAEKGILADGETLELPYHNCKINNRYVFFANITSFTSITFKKEDNTYITVDSTNMTIHNDDGNTVVAHGLTIGHDIMLMVCNETSYRFSLIRVASDGVIFDYTDAKKFLMDGGSPKIISANSTLTDCTFSWVSQNINAPIWVFGDSYLSWYDSRWTYYLAADEYTKVCMLNGYAGQASDTAYTALVNLLNITTPKKVVWCLGMNNPDYNTDNGGTNPQVVNPYWYDYYQRVINLQKKYGFELVLYTVPSTPKMDNSYKDAIIRASDYRYIEADKSVRVDAEGHWVTGALDPDNVHPTIIGAKILYCRFLADLPELMCNC